MDEKIVHAGTSAHLRYYNFLGFFLTDSAPGNFAVCSVVINTVYYSKVKLACHVIRRQLNLNSIVTLDYIKGKRNKVQAMREIKRWRKHKRRSRRRIRRRGKRLQEEEEDEKEDQE